jgi:hypothetical protein
MSLTTAAAALPIQIPGVRFAKVFTRFDELGAAGQRLWIFLWEKTAFGTRTARLTDREIALACGRGIRWVQKAIAQLLNFEEDGTPTPLIDRFRQYGPRHLAGRVIQILVDFAKPADTPTVAKAKPKTPNPAPPRPTTPPPPAEPKLTPEEARQAADWLRAEIDRIKAQDDAPRPPERARQATADTPTLPTKPIKGVNYDDLKYLEVKEKLGALTEPERARLDAARGNRGP